MPRDPIFGDKRKHTHTQSRAAGSHLFATTTNNMAPTLRRAAMSTVNHNNDQNMGPTIKTNGKRKADASPIRHDKVKRSALGNLTNAVPNNHADIAGKVDVKPAAAAAIARKKAVAKKKNENIPTTTTTTNTLRPSVSQSSMTLIEQPIPRPTKVQTRASARGKPVASPIVVAKPAPPPAMKAEFNVAMKPTARRISNEFSDETDKQRDESTDRRRSLCDGRIVVNAVAQNATKLPPTRRISNDFDDTLYMSW